MQDAPRIKGQLKACALKTEVTNPPDSLREIANRVVRHLLFLSIAGSVVLIRHLMPKRNWDIDHRHVLLP